MAAGEGTSLGDGVWGCREGRDDGLKRGHRGGGKSGAGGAASPVRCVGEGADGEMAHACVRARFLVRSSGARAELGDGGGDGFLAGAWASSMRSGEKRGGDGGSSCDW